MKKIIMVLMVVCIVFLNAASVFARTFTETHTISANNYSDWYRAITASSFKRAYLYGNPGDVVVQKIVPTAYKTFTLQVPNGMGPKAPLITKKVNVPVSFQFTVHKHEWKFKGIWIGVAIVYDNFCTECGAEQGKANSWVLPDFSRGY
jgi:hypothetical protein